MSRDQSISYAFISPIMLNVMLVHVKELWIRIKTGIKDLVKIRLFIDVVFE